MNPNKPAQVSADARRRRTVLIAVCVALMAVVASVSGLNVAQPDLAIAFGASQRTILWIINLYTLTLAALLVCILVRGPKDGRPESVVKDDDSLRGITERSPEGSFPSA
ncbi:hypothetical protein ACFVVP_10810 [Streptomyces sp. NPDC058128]|uniref:hypothetical protein n=1 Tax=Streptomyces sp. NPDC058128 TaxID=3346352 RepID=UPI0036EE517A